MDETKKFRKDILIFFVISIVVVLDQFTKQLVLKLIDPLNPITVIPNFFNITVTFNLGAAFGMFSDMPDLVRTIVLSTAALLALSAVIYFMLKDYKDDVLGLTALSMILGGAIGNIIDRAVYGKVVDFIDWYYGNYHWPAFNLADSAICVGVAALIFHRPKKQQSDEHQAEE